LLVSITKYLKFQLQQRQEKIDELHAHIGERVTEAAAMMTAWRWSITTQITAYNAANEANGNLFPVFSTGMTLDSVVSILESWKENHSGEYDDKIIDCITIEMDSERGWSGNEMTISASADVTDADDLLDRIFDDIVNCFREEEGNQ